MESVNYILNYIILQSMLQACCRKMDEQNKIAKDKDPLTSIVVTIYDTDNEFVRFWRQANKEQLRLVNDYE